MNNQIMKDNLESLYSIYKSFATGSKQQALFLDTVALCGLRNEFNNYVKERECVTEKEYSVMVKFIHFKCYYVSATSEKQAINKVAKKIEKYEETLPIDIAETIITTKSRG